MPRLFRTYSDQEVIEGIQQGGASEDKMISFLLKKNESPIYDYVLKNSGNRESASSILIEGITELLFNVRKGTFRGESSLNTYLFSICKGLWLKHLRKEKRHVDWNDQLDEASEEDTIKELYGDLKLSLEAVLSQIGASCKKVLELWSMHYSMTEIALQMSYKNAQIAMNKKNKCLTALKSHVASNQSLKEHLLNYLQ